MLLDGSATSGPRDDPALRALREGRDPLTGALARYRLCEEVDRALAAARRYGEAAALCVLDLDNFRFVNEVHGHAAGDRLLSAAAHALTARLRITDALGRIGADEFGVVLPRTELAAARSVARELLSAIRSHAGVIAAPDDVRITASIGIAAIEAESLLTATELLAEADLAMIAAKEAGRDRIAVADFGAGGAGRVRASLSWAARIRGALETGGLDLHAQPIVPLAAPGPDRYELLVRFPGSDAGPAEFLSTAERFGQIQAIDGWVVTRALDLLARSGDTVLHVNLAAASISDPELMAFIERSVRAADLAPGRLVFEITETAAIGDLLTVRATIGRLRGLGCAVALDDFGTGFASFSYLKQLPLDMVKIDGQFVRDLPESLVDRLAVGAMASIARGLGLATVAEYVPGDDAIELLRELGVDHAQGFHVGAPAPAADLWG